MSEVSQVVPVVTGMVVCDVIDGQTLSGTALKYNGVILASSLEEEEKKEE